MRHLKPMASRMRGAASIALQGFGFDPRWALHRAFNAAFYCRSAMIDGKPAAMWGACGTLLGEHAYVWLVLSDDVVGMPRAILKEARRELMGVMESYPAISATVLPDDQASVRFARHLGFGAEHVGEDVMTDERYRIPVGDHYAIRMVYRPESVH